MSNRTLKLHDFLLHEHDNKRNVVRVEVAYCEGGMNYFTYRDEKRGLYVSASPVEITTKGQFESRTYVGFSGIKQCFKEMKRFSQKQLDNAQPDIEDVQRLLDQVCDKNGITKLDAKQIPIFAETAAK